MSDFENIINDFMREWNFLNCIETVNKKYICIICS